MERKWLSSEYDNGNDLGEAFRLALRNLVWLRPRTVVPLLIIALLTCALDFFAGCQRLLMQKEANQAAFVQGLGQLALVPAQGNSFADGEAERLARSARATAGIALAAPHTARRELLQYVAIYVTEAGNENRVRAALTSRLGATQARARVIDANLLSKRYLSARRRANAELGLAGLALLVLAGAISFAAAAVNGKHRRRELVVLRSFGLQRRGVTAQVMAEGIVVGIGAVVLATMLSSATSWLADGLGRPLPVELDPMRLMGTMAALLAVSIAAAAIPAFKAVDSK